MPQGLRQAFIHSVQRQASSAYAISRVRPDESSRPNVAYAGTNTRQKMSFTFQASGVTLRPDSQHYSEAPAWEVGLNLTAFGTKSDLASVREVDPVVSGNRAEYHRATSGGRPALTEWYLNGPFGLEQGFTIAEAPGPPSQRDGVVLHFEVDGGLTPQPSPDGQRILFADLSGSPRLRYDSLYAYDAQARALAAEIAFAGERLEIRVDDRHARYPVTIDPLFRVVNKITAPDAQPGDTFGWSVGISGDHAIIGAPFEDGGVGDPLRFPGAAYIFRRTASNVWDGGTKITAFDAQEGDIFGRSVGISGDYAIVGAPWEDGTPTNLHASGGAAYIYRRIGTNAWDAGTKITAPDAEQGDEFGGSVGISGDHAIVGAEFEDFGERFPSLPEAGAAYIFHRIGTNAWDAGTKIVAPDVQAGRRFAVSVGISGDYAIAGQLNRDGAYIFHRIGTNTWDSGVKLIAPDAQPIRDLFGASVGISGDYAIVGARHEDGGDGDPLPGSGAAYIFQRTVSNAWDGGTKIAAPDAQVHDQFGMSVGISGDYAVVGSPFDDGGSGAPQNSSGAAYIFRRTGPNAWDAGTKITAPDAQAGDSLGLSVGIGEDYAIVGAYLEDGGAGDPLINSGAAYIYGPDQSDVTIDKLFSPNPAMAGGQTTVTLTAMNGGPSDAENVDVTDVLPAGLTFDSSSDCTVAGWTVSCDFGTVAMASTATMSFVADIDPGATDNITNVAAAGTTTPESDNTNNSATEVLEVDTLTDVTVAKSFSPNPVTTGLPATVTLTAMNAGPSNALNVVASDVLPAGLAFVSSTDCSESAGIVSCGFGSVAMPSTPTLSFVVNVDPGATGNVPNLATIATTTPESDDTNNLATSVLSIGAETDLMLTKTAQPAVVTQRDLITYTLTVTNNGPSDAQNVVLTDTLPGFTSLLSSRGCGFAGDVVTLGAGASASFTIRVRVAPNASAALTNTASVASTTIDPNPANNFASATTALDGATRLSASQFVTPNPLVAGAPATKRITVINIGPGAATNVVLTDPLPDGLTFASAPAGCSFAGGVVTCTAPLLLVGGSATFEIGVTVDEGVSGTITNTFTATAGEIDGPISSSRILPVIVGGLPIPTPFENGVVDTADFVPFGQPGHGVAPKSSISIFGTGFVTEGEFVADSIPLPTMLGGVMVTLDGIQAPLFLVTPRLIIAQLPMGVPLPTATMLINNGGGGKAVSQPQEVQLAEHSPGIFTLTQNGEGQAIVTFAGTADLAAPVGTVGNSHPATAGDFLTIWANGMGPVDPPIEDGHNSCEPDGICLPDGSNVVLRHTTTVPVVRIGGFEVPEENILFSGSSPASVGVNEIVFEMPGSIPPGNAIPITLEIGGVTSKADVTMAVE